MNAPYPLPASAIASSRLPEILTALGARQNLFLAIIPKIRAGW